MGRTSGKRDLPAAKRGALIALSEQNHISNRQLANRYHCDEKTVPNVLKRAGEAEKENNRPIEF